MNDNVYIFDKITRKRTLLGEIQADFNMSLVIDGTKDSATVLVWSYADYQIEPYTILWHEKTNTWWVVSHDKIERYENENSALWVHNLDLLGAIELCNARDLTDCGFNDKTYTRNQFINRLIGLSTFEYEFEISTELSLVPNVEFLKTFENYTLLSALREFLDAFNSCAKLTFTTRVIDNETYIHKAIFNILLKTGNKNLSSHNFSDFTETRETKIMDKSSFGTCVISNADNVVSTQAKTYPATGVVGFSANEYTITFDNALIRLPTPVYKANWLKMIFPSISIVFFDPNVNTNDWTVIRDLDYSNDKESVKRLRNFINNLRNSFNNVKQELLNNVELIWKRAKEYHTTTFYNGVEYKPDKTFVKPSYVPYIPEFNPIGLGDDLKMILCPKNVKENMNHKQQGIAWERGSNLITGFEMFTTNRTGYYKYTDGGYLMSLYSTNEPKIFITTIGSPHCEVVLGRYGDTILSIFEMFIDNPLWSPKFIVNYIPMADLKLKVDNNRDKKDIHLYNQNGKFSDSYALSKLLNSYSKEISSDNITKYAHYYDFDSVPKVGSFVFKNNETYVINNVSLNFMLNESGYYIDCEFTMSKWVSTKSIMVNPNTNVRDYGIPQQYNVKRKQLYRDYYELSYETYNDANQETPYLLLNKVLKFGKEYEKLSDYAVLMKIDYDNEVEGEYSWYYQLDCTTILMQKQMVILCQFLDNNIIGYCSYNREQIFDVSNLFSQHSLINTPISYVDDLGKLKGIRLLFVNQENRGELDYAYYQRENVNADYDAIATQIYIPKELYDIALGNWYDFEVNEPNYNKDALEVPVFEYCCQIEDSNEILIGDNVLQQYENCVYFYDLMNGVNFNQNNVYDLNNVSVVSEEIEPGVFVEYWEITNAVKIEYNGSYELRITYYDKVRYNPTTGEWSYGTQLNIPTNIDIAIYRHSKGDTNTKDLLFICKNVSSEHIVDNGKTLVLKVNYYKLK